MQLGHRSVLQRDTHTLLAVEGRPAGHVCVILETCGAQGEHGGIGDRVLGAFGVLIGTQHSASRRTSTPLHVQARCYRDDTPATWQARSSRIRLKAS